MLEREDFNSQLIKTQIIKVDPVLPDREQLEPAARAARDGKLVVFPTDTVYGVGTNGLLPGAAVDIFTAKNRPADKPLILLIAEIRDVYRYVAEVNEIGLRLMEHFWPGALTLIFKKTDLVPNEVSAGGDTIGIRCPSHPVARMLIKLAGVALATTSANVSGMPSPITADDVIKNLWGRVSYIIDAGPTQIGVESTIVDVSWGEPAIVREGAISRYQILDALEGLI